jgi:hypothetical protein
MAATRASWLDESTNTPLIDDYAREMTTFVEAMADGHVTDAELKAQEQRLVALLKEVEPTLNDEQHAAVTRLLCEVSAYSFMQVLHEMVKHRVKTQFRG